MQDRPARRRRPRGPRRGRRTERPTRAPAQPTPPPASRVTSPRAPALRPSAPRAARGRARQRQPRTADEIRPGTRCVILLDCREGEPDRTGAKAAFEGFFDPETGDPRRPGAGIPRLRIVEGASGDAPHTPERVWGFECWWRLDPEGAGLVTSDREELEVSKRLLRGLIRDSRRQVRPRTEVPAVSRTTGP